MALPVLPLVVSRDLDEVGANGRFGHGGGWGEDSEGKTIIAGAYDEGCTQSRGCLHCKQPKLSCALVLLCR